MYCEHCGTKLSEHARFCPTCGSATSEQPPADGQESASASDATSCPQADTPRKAIGKPAVIAVSAVVFALIAAGAAFFALSINSPAKLADEQTSTEQEAPAPQQPQQPLAAAVPELLVEDDGRGYLDVAVSLVHLAPILEQRVLEDHAVRQEEREAGPLRPRA